MVGEQRRHPVPGCVGARMPVQQHHRRPGTTVTHPQAYVPDLQPVQCEPLEHGTRLTASGTLRCGLPNELEAVVTVRGGSGARRR